MNQYREGVNSLFGTHQITTTDSNIKYIVKFNDRNSGPAEQNFLPNLDKII